MPEADEPLAQKADPPPRPRSAKRGGLAENNKLIISRKAGK